MTLSNEDAIREVRALLCELGIECVPSVLAERSNLVLALDPHPMVARVAIATSIVRIGMAWLRREVEIARFLGARGAAVTRPISMIEAGPFERAGMVISVWERERLEGAIDPAAAGRELARAHRLLEAFPRESLPAWGGWTEAREVLARARTSAHVSPAELARIERAWERGERIVESAESRSASVQPIHGDAHLGNVLATARGTLWTDWEDAFVGPVEFDLACVRSRLDLLGEDREAIDAASAAYDRELDADLVRDLALVRNLQVIPWLAVFAERDPSVGGRMRQRIARLPA